ncbi:MAG: diguanylate cyclase [Firmicutes bacterium]|nr:diguanylate cyclase [Bacillota bacterium]MDH7494529.1 diguanylate cyclase [Bacillota bacterium]
MLATACLLPHELAFGLSVLAVLVGCVHGGVRGGLAFAGVAAARAGAFGIIRLHELPATFLVEAALLGLVATAFGSLVDVAGGRTTQRVGDADERHAYEALVNLMQEGMVLVDLKENILFANNAFAQMLGYDSGDLVGRSLSELTSPEQFRVYREKTKWRKKGRSDRYESKMFRKNGEIVDVLVSATPFVASDGTVKGTIGVFWDITDRKREEEQLKYLSMHDGLTGVYNRSHFEREMRRLDAERYLPVSMIVCDVDDLKGVNDAHGHSAGDALLKRAAEIVRGAVRSSDIVARIGGDEFAVLLPNTSANAAKAIRERIRQHAAMAADLLSSFSLGVATRETMDVSMAQLFKSADDAMYSAKPRSTHAWAT